MIEHFKVMDELDREEFSNDRAIDYWVESLEDDEEKEVIYNRTVQHEPIDFGLGSVTYWGVSRFVFSVILVLITVLPVFSQDMYSHMVDPIVLPEGYAQPYRPLPLPYFNPCYHTEYDNFYLRQLYYDSVYNYIYNKTHGNNFTIRRYN